jgi:hypothetical protein
MTATRRSLRAWNASKSSPMNSRVQGESDAARELADRIKREVDAARTALKIPGA